MVRPARFERATFRSGVLGFDSSLTRSSKPNLDKVVSQDHLILDLQRRHLPNLAQKG